MGDRIVFNGDNLRYAETLLTRLEQDLSDVSGRVSRIDTSADWWRKCRPKLSSGTSDARTGLKSIGKAIRTAQRNDKELASAMGKTIELFENTESSVCAMAGGAAKSEEPGFWERFWNEFTGRLTWSSVLSGSNYIHDVMGLIQGAHGSMSYGELFRGTWKFMTKAAKEWKNYMKIGRAVGKGKATWWFFRNATGLKSAGYASTKAGFFSKIKANLTNKGSATNLRKAVSDYVGDFTGKNGVGTAVASWAGFVMDGISNYSANRQEQAESGGTMSDGRVWAETVTETVVGMAIDCGAKAVVGAVATSAVTTALAAVGITAAGAPAIVVTAGSALIVAGIQAGVKAATDKTVTEWVSDAILDAPQNIAKAGETIKNGIRNGAQTIGNATKGIGQALGRWFSKPSFAF